MSIRQGPLNLLKSIDIRLSFVGMFMLFMAVWHISHGTLFPDAIFFIIVGLVCFWLAIVGLGREEGIEMGEGESSE